MIIKSNLPDNRVALWERHPDHPGGEIFVVGDNEVEVAETHAVKTALNQGRVVEVEKKKVGKKAADGDSIK